MLLCVCYEWTLYFYTLRIWLGFKKSLLPDINTVKVENIYGNELFIVWNWVQPVKDPDFITIVFFSHPDDDMWWFLGIDHHWMVQANCCCSVKDIDGTKHTCPLSYIIKWKVLQDENQCCRIFHGLGSQHLILVTKNKPVTDF